jgi:transposase
MKNHSSDITDSQWMLLQGILRDNRKRKHSLLDIFNAIFYLLKTGYHWRMLPGCFPKWELVYYYFTKWKNTCVIEQIHECYVTKYAKKQGEKSLQVWFSLIACLLRQQG